MKNLISLSLLVLLSASLAAAQDKDSLDHPTKEYQVPTEMIITAPRMNIPLKEAPFATSIVGSDIIQDLPKSVAADEPMKLVPGVKVDNQADGERVHMSIRGQGILSEHGIRGIKILLDGIPLNDPTGFASDFFDVDFAGVDRIEVLRGPAASLYGGSAAGGIVNIMTQNSLDKPLYAEAQTSYGTNNFWKGFGEFGGNVDKVNYNISFSRAMSDGYRQHSGFWGNNVYGKATYSPSEGVQITPIFGYAHVYNQNPEGIPLSYYQRDPTLPNDAAIPLNEYIETERTTNGLKGHFAIDDKNEIDALTFVKRTLFFESSNGIFNYRTFVTPGASFEYDYTMGSPASNLQNRVAVGTDLQWQNIDQHRVDDRYFADSAMSQYRADTLMSNEKIKQSAAGVFLVDKLTVDQKLSFFGSLRYDAINNELDDLYLLDGDQSGSKNFSKVTGRVGAAYSLIPEANLFASWGMGFMPPATEELLINPDTTSAGVFLGGFNPHLEPATSQGVEGGSRGTFKNGLTYDITVFYLATDNDFDRYRLTNYPQLTFYKNTGGTHRTGVEFYGRYTPVSELNLQVAYTYSHFTYVNDSPDRIVMDDPTIVKYIKAGNFLPNSPQHQIYVDAEYHVVPRLSLGLGFETLSKSYIDGANLEGEAVPGYTLVHARISCNVQLGPVSCDLSVNGLNLGNIKYVAFSEPDPGGNAYQPGAGKEFFGQLRIHL